MRNIGTRKIDCFITGEIIDCKYLARVNVSGGSERVNKVQQVRARQRHGTDIRRVE